MDFDFVVIGGGMAGLSVAAELSPTARVAVVEQESQPGYHATGRSAALYSEWYGNAPIRSLTRGSRQFYFDPPGGFSETQLVSPRGTLYFAQNGEEAALDLFAASLAAESRPERLTAARTRDLVPLFKPGYLGGSLHEAGSADIDVSAVLQGYAAVCRRQNVQVAYDSPVRGLARSGDGWVVETPTRSISAAVLINAAGAWGDEIAKLAGVEPVGLVPKRRTAVLVEVPNGLSAHHWPAAIHVAETFYFKPDAGLLLVSPADETPSAPCDAQPEELDIAIAVDKFEEASGSQVRKLRSSWAGLRTFVVDKTPVVGFDPRVPGFFWMVGQGGYGIQTAPAMARLASALALSTKIPADLLDFGLDVDLLSPGRTGLR